MSKTEVTLDKLSSLAKRRGFIYQGSEVYGGLSGTWDYGPLGLKLKKNIENLWWRTFVDERHDMYGVDAAILMNQKVWQASGHMETFTDPLVECGNCKARFREDHLNSEVCPVCGKADSMGESRQFNMMFETTIGPVNPRTTFVEKSKSSSGEVEQKISFKELPTSLVYLRPETAQGIFTNYKNVVDSFYPDLPFGIAQIGKAFRNEISPRDFVFRSREFNQMEIEYFIREDNWEAEFATWQSDIKDFLIKQLGLDSDKLHEEDVVGDELAHYSKKTIDFNFDFPHGSDELLGLAYRTNFDLKNIQDNSGKSMEYRVKGSDDSFIPHVIEPSFGLERALMAVLTSAYREDEVEGKTRTYLALPEHLAPIRYAVSPLLKNKPELVDKAREVYKLLHDKHPGRVMWDDSGNIGKRYRRQDEIGTPECVVIDFETIEDDGKVTVRNRDTTRQKRTLPEKLD